MSFSLLNVSVNDMFTNDSDNSSSFLADSGFTTSILHEPWIKYPLAVLYIGIFTFCITGNVLVLVVVGIHPGMRSRTNFLLANLAIADLFVGLLCMIQNAVQMQILPRPEGDPWPFGSIMCHFYMFTLHFVPCASVGILILLSVERYIAVLHPILAGAVLTPTRLVTATALVWAICVVANLPYVFWTRFHTMTFGGETKHLCIRSFNHQTFLRAMHTINFVLWYVVPLMVMSFIYRRIGIVLWRGDVAMTHSSNRHTTNEDPAKTDNGSAKYKNSTIVQKRSIFREQFSKQKTTLSLEETINGFHSISATEHRRRVIRVLLAVIIAFALLSGPYYVRQLWNVWRSPNEKRCVYCFTELAQPLSFLLFFANSAINPFVYALMSQRFREAAMDLCFCRIGRNFRRRQEAARQAMQRQSTGEGQGAPMRRICHSMSSNGGGLAAHPMGGSQQSADASWLAVPGKSLSDRRSTMTSSCRLSTAAPSLDEEADEVDKSEEKFEEIQVNVEQEKDASQYKDGL